jgi:hypothetical protein
LSGRWLPSPATTQLDAILPGRWKAAHRTALADFRFVLSREKQRDFHELRPAAVTWD